MKRLFFDLDGTITNSQEGIINSFKYALNYYGIEIKDDSEMKKVLGPPLHYSFENFFNIKKENIEEVVKKYREYYNSKGLYENSVYEGMEEVIKTLKGNNKKLVIATSKPTYFTKKF